MDKFSKYLKITSFILFFSIFFCSIIFAAHTGAHDAGHSSEEFKAQLWDFVWKIINFGILAFLFYKLLKKPLKGFLSSRREKIETAIVEAENSLKLAKDREREYEEKIKNLEKERAKIIEQYKQEGELEKKRIIELAEEKAKKIVEQAQNIIELEIIKEKEEIKKKTAQKILILAEELVKKNINEDDHKRIINDSLERMVNIN